MLQFSSLEQEMDAGNHFKNRKNRGDKLIYAPKKHFLLALCIIAINLSCLAQDIIVTKDAKRMNAKVTEVNVDNVRYKNYDNLDGPVYTLLKSDIASIVYQNGQEETFSSESTTQTMFIQTTEQTASVLNRTQIVSSGNVLEDMQTFNSALYLRYKSGKQLATTGWIFTGVGVACIVTEFIFWGDAEGIFLAGGALFAGGGIPLLIIGNGRKDRALSDFNRQYYSSLPAKPHFQMKVYPNRVGLAYVF